MVSRQTLAVRYRPEQLDAEEEPDAEHGHIG